MSKPQNSRFSVKHRPKLKILSKMLQISPGFWLLKEANDISNIQSKFQAIQAITFLQNGDFLFSQATSIPPYPPSLTAYLTPKGPHFVSSKWPQRMFDVRFWFLFQVVITPLRWYLQFFFHQNDSEGCRTDHIDGLNHFLFGSGATGKNPLGVLTTPPW